MSGRSSCNWKLKPKSYTLVSIFQGLCSPLFPLLPDVSSVFSFHKSVAFLLQTHNRIYPTNVHIYLSLNCEDRLNSISKSKFLVSETNYLPKIKWFPQPITKTLKYQGLFKRILIVIQNM